MEKFTSFEQRKIELNQMIEEVRQHAISFDRAKEVLALIQASESQEEIQALNNELTQSSVTVKTLPEFKILLQNAELDEEEVLYALEHENAHANVVEIVVATNIGYSLLICKNGENFMYKAWAEFSHPTEWFKTNKEAIKRIYSAPEEYGDVLSNDDKENLRQLED